MIEYVECLSGHMVLAYNFGRDASNLSGRHRYCNDCRRNHRNNETAEKNEQGFTATGEPYHVNESERAIEREREKRREEKTIEIQLRESESESDFESSESVFRGLSGPMREGKKFSSWSVQ